MLVNPLLAAAQDTNALEIIQQLQRKIDALEQKVKRLEENPEQREREAKSNAQIDQLTRRVKELESGKESESALADKARQQAEALEQKVKSLNQDREQEIQEAEKKAKTTPTVTLGANGLVVKTADSNFLMNLHGYVQADGRFHVDDHSPINNTFLLRRVRPIIEGTVYDKLDYRLMTDFGSGNASSSTSANNALINDAFVNARFWPQFQVQAGKYKAPVGLERLQSTAELLFVETGYATQLTPNYDLGVMIHNNLFNTPINYAVGVFNGAVDGGSNDSDVDNGKDVVGRLFFQPLLNGRVEALSKLGFGVGGSAGRHSGALPTYKTPGQQTFFSYAAGVVADGYQYRVDPQLYYYYGPFGILGEYAISSQDVTRTTVNPKTTERFEHKGWQVEGSWFLTGDYNWFRATSRHLFQPDRPFAPAQGNWGALELVGRLQRLTLDKDAFPTYVTATSANEATTWGIGLNWYLNSNFRFYLDYEQTRFEGGSSASGSVTSNDEKLILGRIQVSF
jgi:phosphate-selective porin OprO/OprP